MLRAAEPYRIEDRLVLPYVVRMRDEAVTTSTDDNEECDVCGRFVDGDHVGERFYFEMRLSGDSQRVFYHSECFWTAMRHGTNVISVALIDGFESLPFDVQTGLTARIAAFNRSRSPSDDVRCGRRLFPFDQSAIPEDELHVLILSSVFIIKSGAPPFRCTLCNAVGHSAVAVFVSADWSHLQCVLRKSGLIIGGVETISGLRLLRLDEQQYLADAIEKRIEELGESTGSRPVMLRQLSADHRPILVLSITNVICWPDSSSAVVTEMCSMCSKPFSSGSPVLKYHGRLAHSLCVFKYASLIFDVPEMMPEWWELSVECRKQVRLEYELTSRDPLKSMWTFPPRAVTEPPKSPEAKRRRIEEAEPEPEPELARSQHAAMSKWREFYGREGENVIGKILAFNGQDSKGLRKIRERIERLVDITVFGVPVPCEKCSGAVHFHPARRDYLCDGFRSAFTRCNTAHRNPRRQAFRIPEDVRSLFETIPIETFPHRVYNPVAPSSVERRPPVPELIEIASEKFDPLLRAHYPELYYVKDRTAVPASFPSACSFHVARDASGAPLTAFLTTVDHEQNRNSASELILLRDDSKPRQALVRIDSRIGTSIRKKTIVARFGTREMSESVDYFRRQFYEETGNEWNNRDSFSKKPGKSFYVETDYPELETAHIRSVPTTVRDVLKTLLPDFPNKFEYYVMIDMSIDSCPAVSLRMKELATRWCDELRRKIVEGAATSEDVVEYSNRVYSAIPTNVGVGRLALLDSPQKIDAFLKRFDEPPPERLLVDDDEVYEEFSEELRCYLTALPRDSDEWNIVHDYFMQTRGPSHIVKDGLFEIFKIEPLDEDPIGPPDFPGERLLLWHGTRKENVCGILSEGLRREPTRDVRRTGAMLGDGIYFADVYTKSAMYSAKQADGKCDAYVFLAEVSLGNCFPTFTSMDRDAVQLLTETLGYHSIKGIGRCSSTPNGHKHLFGHLVPTGEPVRNAHIGGALEYNEYAVFDEKRIRLKYMLRVEIIKAAYE